VRAERHRRERGAGDARADAQRLRGSRAQAPQRRTGYIRDCAVHVLGKVVELLPQKV